MINGINTPSPSLTQTDKNTNKCHSCPLNISELLLNILVIFFFFFLLVGLLIVLGSANIIHPSSIFLIFFQMFITPVFIVTETTVICWLGVWEAFLILIIIVKNILLLNIFMKTLIPFCSDFVFPSDWSLCFWTVASQTQKLYFKAMSTDLKTTDQQRQKVLF